MRQSACRRRYLLRSLRNTCCAAGFRSGSASRAEPVPAGTRSGSVARAPQQPAPNPYQPVPQYAPVQPVYNPNDHTADFTAEDISKNKVVAMAAYVLGMIGIVIALLAAPESPYASFHSRQALKLEIVSQLLLVVSLVLCWTFIVPILGGIALAVVYVVRIICFFQVCSGKAKDAAIVGSLPFLK